MAAQRWHDVMECKWLLDFHFPPTLLSGISGGVPGSGSLFTAPLLALSAQVLSLSAVPLPGIAFVSHTDHPALTMSLLGWRRGAVSSQLTKLEANTCALKHCACSLPGGGRVTTFAACSPPYECHCCLQRTSVCPQGMSVCPQDSVPLTG